MDRAVLHRNYSPLAYSSPERLREVSSQLGSLLDLSSHQLLKSKTASSDCHEKRKERKKEKRKRKAKKREEKKGGKKGKEEKKTRERKEILDSNWATGLLKKIYLSIFHVYVGVPACVSVHDVHPVLEEARIGH